MRQRVLQVTQDTVLGLNSLLHLFADIIHLILCQPTPLSQLPERKLLLLQLTFKHSEFLLQLLILIVRPRAQLRNSLLELLIH